MRMSFGVMLCAGTIALAAPVYAKSCDEMRAAKATIEKAETKQAVAEGLIAAGARPSDAANLAAASPDVDVAKAAALRAVTPKTEATCRK